MRSGSEAEQEGAGLLELRLIRRKGVDFGSFGGPPQVGARHQAVLGADERGDVLDTMPWRRQQLHRRGELVTVSRRDRSTRRFVDGPMVVKLCLGKEGGIERVVGVVVTENHVGDGAGIDLERTQWIENHRRDGPPCRGPPR